MEVLTVVVLGKVVRVDHREHLRKSLAYSCDSLRWVSEWKLAPSKIVDPLTVEIDNVLGTRCAGCSSEWLLREHSVVLVLISTLAHEEIVHVFQVLFKKLQRFSGVIFVGKLLLQGLHNFVETL